MPFAHNLGQNNLMIDFFGVGHIFRLTLSVLTLINRVVGALLRENLRQAGKECSQLVKSKASRKVRKKITKNNGSALVCGCF